jgi:tetratricopeptide (TPR) repeat protein
MKLKYFYILFFVFAGSIIIFALSKKKPRTELTLLERKGYIANSGEWLNTKAAIEKLLADIRSNPKDNKAKINLALAYIQESRITGNHGYYDAAAMQLVDDLLSENGNDVQALCAKATIQLSQHHFADALQTGNKVTKLNPYSAYSFGILTDANVELGKYDEAIKSADKMVSLRPDMRSYSRVSYLREIFGDVNGAIDAMKMAVSSGVPGTEQTEWARVYVGHLYEVSGKAGSAEMQYRLALIHRPNYPFAYAGLGRVAKEKRDYVEAIKYFTLAKDGMSDYSFNDELTDVYRATLKRNEAETELTEAIDMLKANNGSEGSSAHGHYSDRELALLYLKDYNYDLALLHALTEYNRRPDNIDVNQTLAWVRYARGEYDDANKKIDAALRTGSKNPMLLLQAGLIKIKSGNMVEGRKLLNQSLAINPCTDPVLKHEIEKTAGKNDFTCCNTLIEHA